MTMDDGFWKGLETTMRKLRDTILSPIVVTFAGKEQ